MDARGYYTKAIPTPSGKRKYIRARSPQELERKVLEAKLELGIGVDIADNITFGELAQTWFDVYKKPSLTPQTLSSHMSTFNRHIMPLLALMPVRSIKPIHIQQLINQMSDTSIQYQRIVLAMVKSVLDMAIDNGTIVRNPVTKHITLTGKEPKPIDPLTKQELDTLLSAVSTQSDMRATVLFFLLIRCSMRIGEACGLMWQDVDLENGFINVKRTAVFSQKVVQDNPKTKAGNRTIPLDDETWNILAQFRKTSTSMLVIHNPTGEMVTYDTCRRILDMATSIVGRRVKPHQLRHSGITNWFDEGLDIKEVQYLSGHSTPDMTIRTYTHFIERSKLVQTTEKIRKISIM